MIISKIKGRLPFVFVMMMICIGFHASSQPVFNIRSFGAKADGISDDYPAFIALAKAVNKAGRAKVVIPEGRYFIAAFHTEDNDQNDIEFKQCSSIEIDAKNAIILVNGNFKRTVDRKTGRHQFSKIRPVIPFSFKNCSNIIFNDLEIDGGVGQMTREPGIVESGSNLVRLFQCSHVSLNHLNLHHAETDALYIIGDSSVDIHADQCIFSNNARQAMSVIGLVNGSFTGCQFINTGITGGAYGRHKPSDGVDIEPRYAVRDILFDHCIFSNNLGGQFVCTAPKYTSNINLKACTIDAGSSTRPFQLLLYANGLVVDDCSIDCGKGSIYATWKHGYDCVTEIRNCRIRSGAWGIYGLANDSSNCRINVHDNTLVNTADTVMVYFPCLKLPGLSFYNNTVKFEQAKVLLSKDGFTSVVEGNGRIEGNTFEAAFGTLKPSVSFRK